MMHIVSELSFSWTLRCFLLSLLSTANTAHLPSSYTLTVVKQRINHQAKPGMVVRHSQRRSPANPARPFSGGAPPNQFLAHTQQASLHRVAARVAVQLN